MIVFKILVALTILALVGIKIFLSLSTARTTGTSPSTMSQKTIDWFTEYLWSIAIVIIGIGAAYWAYHSSLRPADVGGLGYEKWLSIVVFWVVVEILIIINVDDEKKAVKYQKMLRWTILVFLIVLPAWSWVSSLSAPTSASAPQHAVRTEIPLASSPQSSWAKLSISAGEEPIRIPLPLGMHHIDVAGKEYLLHTVYADGHECASFGKETCPDGAVVEYYVSKATGIEMISYAFVPK
ncbi:MAG: hypothetical protein AAB709_02345 [Patescibacteria group bacterium]